MDNGKEEVGKKISKGRKPWEILNEGDERDKEEEEKKEDKEENPG